ncbi:hypothetical protein Tco_0290534 [Tanacetum coccineum]
MKILFVLLEITPDLATRAIKTPLSSLMGTTWCLCDLTPSGWCKMDALSTNIGKGRACVYFNFPFAIKLAIGLNVFQQDPSLLGRILLLGEYLSEEWTRFKDLLQKVPHHGIDLWLQVQIFYDHVNPVTRQTIDQSAGGKLRDRNAKESWALLEDLAFYDNESWNDPRDFAKPVKAISLPQDVSSTSDLRLIKLENQVQRLMEAHFALKQPV